MGLIQIKWPSAAFYFLLFPLLLAFITSLADHTRLITPTKNLTPTQTDWLGGQDPAISSREEVKGTLSAGWPRAGGGAAFWLVPGGAKSLQSGRAPRWRRGRAPGEGGARDLSVTGSSEKQHLPHGDTLSGRGGARRPRLERAGPERLEPIRRAARGGGATARDPNTRARAQPGPARLLGLPAPGPAASPLLRAPTLAGRTVPPPPLPWGSAAAVAGKRAPFFGRRHPPLARHPFLLVLR